MDKETLQKKIESGDTVYKIAGSKIRKIELDFHFRIGKSNLIGDVHKNHAKWSFDKLFATKEEAEWEIEFGNVTWTEKLKLPSWEQIQKNIDWGIDCANRKWCLLKSRGHSIIRIEDWNWNGIYEEPLTYENYLEACRLCKKLFLGEEL